LGFFIDSAKALAILRKLDVNLFTNTLVFGGSLFMSAHVREFVELVKIPYVITQPFPDPEESNLPLIKEYRASMERKGLPVDIFSFEAYFGAALFFDALKKVKSPYKHEAFINYFKALKEYDFKGLKLNYNAADQTIFKKLWLEKNEGPWIEVASASKKGNKKKPTV
jgi:hypothetical protein